MPAKSLGTLAMIYAIGELRNHLPRKTMLCKGDMNNSASRSGAFFTKVRVSTSDSTLYDGGGGGGLYSHFRHTKGKRLRKS